MDKKQKIILWSALALFVLMGVFPPWKDVSIVGDNIISQPVGYGPVFKPPEKADSIDFARLIVQWFLVAVLGAALFTSFITKSHHGLELPKGVERRKKKERRKIRNRRQMEERRALFKKTVASKSLFFRKVLNYMVRRKKAMIISCILIACIFSYPLFFGNGDDDEKPKKKYAPKYNIKNVINSVKNYKQFHGHNSLIRSVAYNPGGNLVATGGYDQSVILWDAVEGKKINTLIGVFDKVRSVAFSPNGKWLACGTGYKKNGELSGEIKLWNVNTGRVVNTFRGHSKVVRSVVFSPNGKLLASGSADHDIKIWDVQTGDETRTLKRHYGEVYAVAFSPNGKSIASGSDGPETSEIKIWNVSKGTTQMILRDTPGRILSLDYSPDGKFLAAGIGFWDDEKSDWTGGMIGIWETKSGRLVKKLKKGITSSINSVKYNQDGKILASGGNDKLVLLWDAKRGKILKKLKGHSYWVFSVDFSPSGEYLSSASGKWEGKEMEGEVIIWGPFGTGK